MLHQSHHLLQGVAHARKKLYVPLDIWHWLVTIKKLDREAKLIVCIGFGGIRHGSNHRSKVVSGEESIHQITKEMQEMNPEHEVDRDFTTGPIGPLLQHSQPQLWHVVTDQPSRSRG